MVRAVLLMLLLGLLAASASAATQPRLTRCEAITFTQGGRGQGLFTGTCNSNPTTLKVTPGSVVGRVGGLYTNLRGNGITYTGRLGKLKARFALSVSSVTGRYGRRAVRFSVVGSELKGRVGSARVVCSVSLVTPLGEQITCAGSRGAAEVLVPVLAVAYAAP